MNATQILQEKDKIIRAKDQRIAELEKENENLKEEWANDQTLKEGYVHQITSLEKELKDVKYGRDEVSKLNLQRTEDLRSANETIQSLQSQLTKCQEERGKIWDAAIKWNEEQLTGGRVGDAPAPDKQQYLSQFDQPKTDNT